MYLDTGDWLQEIRWFDAKNVITMRTPLILSRQLRVKFKSSPRLTWTIKIYRSKVRVDFRIVRWYLNKDERGQTKVDDSLQWCYLPKVIALLCWSRHICVQANKPVWIAWPHRHHVKHNRINKVTLVGTFTWCLLIFASIPTIDITSRLVYSLYYAHLFQVGLLLSNSKSNRLMTGSALATNDGEISSII